MKNCRFYNAEYVRSISTFLLVFCHLLAYSQWGVGINSSADLLDISNCDYRVGETISVGLENDSVHADIDSSIYFLVDSNDIVISYSDIPTFPSLNNAGSYTVVLLVFDQDNAVISNISNGISLSDIQTTGCFDWSDHLVLEVCNCDVPATYVTSDICYYDSLLFGNAIINEPGIYSHTYSTGNGCDSTVNLELTINGQDTIYVFDKICNDSIFFEGSYIKETGVFYMDTQDFWSCNQTIVLEVASGTNLSINSSDSFLPCAFVTGESFTLNANFQNQSSGDSTIFILTSENGDIISIQDILTFDIGDAGDYHVFALTYNFDTDISSLYATSNIYNFDLCGCADMSDPFSFEVCSSCIDEFIAIDEGICFGDEYGFGEKLIDAAGIYFDTTIIQGNCERITRLNLFVINQDTIQQYESICAGDSVLFYNKYYFASGSYHNSNPIGICNQITSLHLDVEENLEFSIPSSFQSCSFSDNAIIQSSNPMMPSGMSDGVYILTDDNHKIKATASELQFEPQTAGNYIIYALGYDILTDVSDVTVGNELSDVHICGVAEVSDAYGFEVCESCTDKSGTITAEICKDEYYDFGGDQITEPGIYSDTIDIGQGCDSISQLILNVINTQDTVYEYKTLCTGDSILFGNEYITSAGTYYITNTLNNCDQVYSLQVTSTESLDIILGTTFESCAFRVGDDINLSTMSPAQNADSTIYILTDKNGIIYEYNSDLQFASYAAGEYQVFALSFDYKTSITSIYLGESILNIKVCGCADLSDPYGFEICAPCTDVNVSITKGICFDDYYQFGNQQLNSPGLYRDTFLLDQGCDSIVWLSLEHYNQDTIFESRSICQGDSTSLGGVYLKVSGIYNYPQVIQHCTQITRLDLDVKPRIDPSIATSFASCRFDKADIIDLDNEINISSLGEIVYILTNQSGIILQVSNSLQFVEEAKGNYAAYALTYDNQAIIDDILQGQSILELQICGSAVMSLPYGFEICSDCVDKYEEVEVTICSNGIYSFGDQLLSVPGIYYDTLLIGEDCDSVIELNLSQSILDSIYITRAVCDGEFLMYQGELYNTGEHFIVEMVNGCEQITKLDLLSYNPQNISLTSSFESCLFEEGDPLMFSHLVSDSDFDITRFVLTDSIGTILEIVSDPLFLTSAAGHYQLFVVSSSVESMVMGLEVGSNLVVVQVCGHAEISAPYGFEVCLPCQTQNSAFTVGICEEGFYQFGERQLNLPGIYKDTIALSDQCDSIIQVEIYYETDNVTDIYKEICAGDSIFFSGIFITEPGIHQIIEIDQGCEKITALHLEFASSLDIVLGESFEVCSFLEGENVILSTASPSENADSTIYILTNEEGQILDIKSSPEFGGQDVGRYLIYALSYELSSTINGLYLGQNILDMVICGCASISSPYGLEVCMLCTDVFKALAVGVCFEDTYVFGDEVLNKQGVYYDTLNIGFQCDSVVQLTLFHLNRDTIRVTNEICGGDSILFDNVYITDAGTFHSDQVIGTCNQVTELTLSVTESIQILAPLAYPSCVFSDAQDMTFSNLQLPQYGDSLVYFIVNEGGFIMDLQSDPEFAAKPSGKYAIYALTFDIETEVHSLRVNSHIDDLRMCGFAMITPPQPFEICETCVTEFFAIDRGICYDEEYNFGGLNLNSPGIYFDTLEKDVNCYDITRLNLFHYNEDTIHVYHTICGGADSILFYNQYYRESGTYHNVGSIGGCSQVSTLHLNVEPALELYMATDFLTNSFYLGDAIVLEAQNVSSEITTYILADEIGNILSIVDSPSYDLDIIGYYQVIPISYSDDATISGVTVGSNVNDLAICGCGDIGTSFGFELIDPSCDTIHTSIFETICFSNPYSFGDALLNVSGVYRDTFDNLLGCDSIVDLTLEVTGGYVFSELPETYDSCYSDPETPVILTFEDQVFQCGDRTVYVLTDDNGTIVSLKNRPQYLGLTPRNYAVYPVNYPADDPPQDLTVFNNITRIGTCSCVEIGEPIGFEICSPCPVISVFPDSEYDNCRYTAGRDYNLEYILGSQRADLITKYIITDEVGIIISVSDNTSLNIISEGLYQSYAIVHEADAAVYGLKRGINISDVVVCGCYDISNGYGFGVCDNEYDLALKYVLDFEDSQNLYSDIPATITVYNQGQGTIYEFGLAAYMPLGLTLSESDSLWSLTADSMAIRTISQIIQPGDSIVIPIIIRSTGDAYDNYLQEVVGVAEITSMRDRDLELVEDVDSYPDNIRDNDKGTESTTDNEIYDNNTFDEDDHDFVKIKFRYIDPTGYIYCEKTGELILGGKIHVEGPGNIRILKDGSDGEYQYLADSSGLYILTITHPNGYPLSLSCNVSSDTFYVANQEGNPAIDRDGIVNDTVVTGSNVVDGRLVDNTCSGNSFYDHLYFDVNGPTMIVNNNIPVQCIGSVTLRCDGSGDNPFVDKLNNVLVELYNCNDTINPIDSTRTANGGGFEFSGITAIGCYKVLVHQNEDFKVHPNEEIGADGWTRDIVLDWGSCDSIVFFCLGQCDVIPLDIGTPLMLDTCAFELGDSIVLAEEFANTGLRDTTVFVLTDSIGKIIEISEKAEFQDPGIGDYFAYGIDLNGLLNIQGLIVDSLINNVASCPADSALVYGPFSVSVCGFFDLALRKTLSSGMEGPFKPFDEVLFDITVYNQGRIGAKDVEIYEHFNKGMILSPNDQLWNTIDDTTAVYYVPELIPPGDSLVVQVLTKLTPYISKNGIKQLVNIAEIASARDSVGQPIVDVDSTPDRVVNNDKGGDVEGATNDEIDDDGSMDEDDSDPEEVIIDELDPQGYIYCDKTGEIITGGTISVSGPGNVTIFKDGSDGSYQYFVDAPGVYSLTYTHPNGYPISPNCTPLSGVYDPTDKDGDPVHDKDGVVNNILQMGSDTTGGHLIDNDCGANPFFFQVEIDPDDPPLISNNNIPVSCIVIASIVCSGNPDGSFENPVPGLEGLEVGLYSCLDTNTPIEIQFTDSVGGYAFNNINDPGCYKIKFNETPQFNVLSNSVVDADGWSIDVVVDWGSCDSTVAVCFTNCNISAPIAIDDTILMCIGGDIPALSVETESSITADWYDSLTGGNLLQSSSLTYTPSSVGTYYAESRYLDTDCISQSRTPITLETYSTLTCIANPNATSCITGYGSVDLTIIGSDTAYSITWTKVGSSQVLQATEIPSNFIIEDLTAGLWTISVFNDNGCISTCQTMVDNPPAVNCGESFVTNPSCNGGMDGKIEITASGGVAPFVYYMQDRVSSNGVFEGVSAGSYAIIVEDNNFCTNLCVISVHDPSALTCTTEVLSLAQCENGIGGAIVIEALGGVSPYTFILNGVENTTGVFSDLSAGIYNTTVRDDQGCTSTCETIIGNADSDLTCDAEVTKSLSCVGANDATIRIIGSGGDQNYTYELNSEINTLGVFENLAAGNYNVQIFDGNNCISVCSVIVPNSKDSLTCEIDIISAPTCTNTKGGSISIISNAINGNVLYSIDGSTPQASNYFENLAADIYNIEVSDSEGCTSSCTVTLTDTSTTVCIIGDVNHVDCFGDRSGSFTVQGRLGTEPYQYKLGEGDFTSENEFTLLEAGDYIVTVRDSSGCTSICEVTINTNTPLSCSIDEISHASCDGSHLGSFTISGQGGTGNYSYYFNADSSEPGQYYNLGAGTYGIVVSDDSGCTSLCEVEILYGDSPSPTVLCSDDVVDLGCNPTKILKGRDLINDGFVTTSDLAIIRLVDSLIIVDGCDREVVYNFVAEGECSSVSDQSCSVRIIWREDDIAPIPPSVPESVVLSCNVRDIPQLYATDNCSDEPILGIKEDSVVAGICNSEFTIHRKWIFEDLCGNISLLTQKINVVDNEPPIISDEPDDIIVYNTQNIPQPENLTAIDNCGSALLEQSDRIDSTDCGYMVVREWKATDDCGNISKRIQNIRVLNCPDSLRYIDLGMEKSVSNSSPRVGDRVIYSLTITNKADVDATGVIVADELPNGLIDIQNISNGGTYTDSNIEWTDLSIEGRSTITLTYTAQVAAAVTGTSYKNVAEIVRADQEDIDSTPDNNDGDQSEDDEDDNAITPLINGETSDSIDLELVKSVNNDVPKVGERITYNLTITNSSTTQATGVSIIDYLPNGLTNVRDISHEGSISQLDLIWSGLIIDSMSSMVLSYTAEVLKPRPTISYKNVAEVSGADQVDKDSSPSNNSGDQSEDDEYAIKIVPDEDGGLPTDSIDLELIKEVSNQNPAVRDVITYTITIRNIGPNTATGIDVVDYLPMEYCSDYKDINHNGYRILDEMRWDDMILNPGEERVLTFTATVSRNAEGEVVDNVAEIVSHNEIDVDSQSDNNIMEEDDQDNALFKVGKVSDLSLSKTILEQNSEVGDTITFSIDFHNDGPDILEFGQVEDILPDGIGDIHMISHSGIMFNDRIVWTARDLGVGDSMTYTFKARIVHFPDQECDYNNVAEITRSSSGDPDSSPDNDDGDQSEDDESSANPFGTVTGSGTSICANFDTQVLLEGIYNYNEGKMDSYLNDHGYLPGQKPATYFGKEEGSGHPYYISPWSYLGSEGLELDYRYDGKDDFAGYPEEAVDYVLVGLRTANHIDSVVCERAALVLSDGEMIYFEDSICCNVSDTMSYYITIQHRNHLVVMSHEKVSVHNGILKYDFRKQNSFIEILGYGQKEVDRGIWAMHAGNGDQTRTTSSSSDINVKDMGVWLDNDGFNSGYYITDYDLNGDVNVHDKGLFLRNNGIFSDVRIE